MNYADILERFVRSLPSAGLVRLLGDAGSGRTSVALRIAAAITSSQGNRCGKCVAIIDTLGHGKEALQGLLPAGLDGDRVVYYQGAGMSMAMSVARHLCFKPVIGVVVVDDLLGLDPSYGSEGAGAFGPSVRRELNVLASACLSQNVLGILVDRLSPSWIPREPIGCTTYVVSRTKGEGQSGWGYQLRRAGNLDPSRVSDVVVPIGRDLYAPVA